MQSLAHYALLGSLSAGAAGVLILAAVTVKHGLKRRGQLAAVLCFAVSAGLGVVGLMQPTRATTPVVATGDTAGPVIEGLHALEKRMASAELDLQSRNRPVPEWRAWEDRLMRLESRLGAIEERAALAEHRVAPPKAPAPRAVAPASSTPRPAPALNASPRMPATETIVPPATATSPPPEPSVPVVEVAPAVTPSAAVVAAPPRETAPAKPEPPAADLPLLEKIRQDWDTVKSHARRGGHEWREGWDQIKRLFR